MIRQPVTPEVASDIATFIESTEVARDACMEQAIEQLENGFLESADAYAYNSFRYHAVVCHLENSIREDR